jgi:anti-sigma factor RsiW
MNCKKIISTLNAYADGEQSVARRQRTEAHLAGCPACRQRFHEIEGLDDILADGLPVPPVPLGFASRVVAAAEIGQYAATEGFYWPFPNPFIWFAEFSASMRLAVGAVAILALVCGLSLNSGTANLSLDGGNTLYGLEWFDANPPSSIGSYIAMNE